jgi:hypothetical protein
VRTFLESDSNFIVPVSGYYYVEAWGADGGHGGKATATNSRGGQGSYQSGLYYFNVGQKIQVQVGERGKNGKVAVVESDITRGEGGRALLPGGATTATWFGAGGAGGEGGNNLDDSGNVAGGGGGGGAASGILSGGNVCLAASGGGGGGGYPHIIYPPPTGGNSNGGGNGKAPGNGSRSIIDTITGTPQGGTVSTPAQPNGGGIPGENAHILTWSGGGGGGGGGGYKSTGGGGGYGGHGSHGYGAGAGGAGGSNWVGGAYYKPASSVDVTSDIRAAVIAVDPLPRNSNGNGVVRITLIGR